MRGSDYQSSNLTVAGIAGVIALIAATLSASMLTGVLQAVVLAVCFAVMAASIVVSLAEQHKLESAAKPQVAEAQEPALNHAAASSQTLSPFPGFEIRA